MKAVSKSKTAILNSIAVLVLWCMGAVVGANASVVSEKPLIIGNDIDHNMVFAVDDSVGMDSEFVSPRNQKRLGYLFDVGTSSVLPEIDKIRLGSITTIYNYDGRMNPVADSELLRNFIKIVADLLKLACLTLCDPFDENTIDELFAQVPTYYDNRRGNEYLRSPAYNVTYYNAAVSYKPWPTGKVLANGDVERLPQYPVTAAPLDYNFPRTTRNLTDSSWNKGLVPASYYRVVTESATVSRFDRNECPAGYKRVAITFFLLGDCQKYVDGPWYLFCADISVNALCYDFASFNKIFVDQNCNSITSNWYDSWKNGVEFRGMGVWDAIGMDGKCLKRVDITDATERQNFSNWFTYHRRRHQVLRGAVGESVMGLEKSRMGMFWYNLRTPIAMNDTSIETERVNFLRSNYQRFGAVDWPYVTVTWRFGMPILVISAFETPSREALKFAGEQFGGVNSPVRGGLACRKNNVLMFSDALTDITNPGVGNADGTAGAPFADTQSNTLADVAYYYYQGLRNPNTGAVLSGGAIPLRRECSTADKTPEMDCNSGHHMNTFAFGIGTVGEKFVGKGYDNVRKAHTQPPVWNMVGINTDDSAAQVDDFYHAAVNGKGEFYNAPTAEALRSAMSDAVRTLANDPRGSAGVSFNVGKVEAGARLFTAEFNPSFWYGTVKALDISNGISASSPVLWDAGKLLSQRNFTTSPRQIVTFNPSTRVGATFSWASLTADQQNALRYGDGITLADVSLGQQRLNFLRGDKSLDGVTMRDRKGWVMGDVVHSSPIHVGKPTMAYSDADYVTFKNAQVSRTPVVYVGANDGMLHAFRASDGHELFAYVPNFAFSADRTEGLHYLTRTNYAYRSFVDLPLAIGDAKIARPGQAATWRTVLIGGSRAGGPANSQRGNGLFALDVTDPAALTEAKADKVALWEFNAQHALDAQGRSLLGTMVAEPIIAKVAWAADGTDVRWSAIFANGYDNPAGVSGVFVLDIEGGAAAAWEIGKNFLFLKASGSTGGLSPGRVVDLSPAGAPDGIADTYFAGDLNGLLFRIELSGNKGKTSTASIAQTLLFTARNTEGGQPITVPPVLAYNIFDTLNRHTNLLVSFGTGRYLGTADPGSTGVQSFYVIESAEAPASRTNLEPIRISNASQNTRTVADVTVDWTTKSGWYTDLPAGERVVQPGLVASNSVIFTTMIPMSGSCAAGGSGWLMSLTLAGTASTVLAPAITESVTNGSGIFMANAGLSPVLFNNQIVVPTILGEVNAYNSAVSAGGVQTRRQGWREILYR